ncbi:MAG: single-stranded DNA-binding protein [Flavobacteriales bacterium]|nr:MAG: single-stranded DNA-binding protein [Flavobacteriales bacterium]
MAGTLNKVMIIGNLGIDPEIRRFEDGNAIARLAVATSESYTNREGQKVTNTEWHNVILRKGLADIAEKYLKKGDKVFVEGRIRTRKWEENGQPRYATEIQADNLTMLGSSRSDDSRVEPKSYDQNNSHNSAKAEEPSPSVKNNEDDSDDLPF